MPTNKQYALLPDAERLYVEKGLETIAIETVLEHAVTRRTLDSWKKKFNWDKKRENYRARMGTIDDRIKNLFDVSLDECLVQFTSKNVQKMKGVLEIASKLGIDLSSKLEELTAKMPASKKTASALRKLLNIPKPKEE